MVPLCPFIAGYIERHPEYADLVDRDLMEWLGRLGLGPPGCNRLSRPLPCAR